MGHDKYQVMLGFYEQVLAVYTYRSFSPLQCELYWQPYLSGMLGNDQLMGFVWYLYLDR